MRAALFMFVAALCFGGMTVLVRLASADLHPFQVAFFRNFIAVLVMAPWILRKGIGRMHTRRLGMYGLRALSGTVAMLAWFWALTRMVLADAVALSFTTPLFVTVGAALFLGEHVRARRWTATGLGFAGTLVVLRPGVVEPSLAALMALLSAAAMATSALVIKSLARTERADTLVAYTTLMMSVLSLVPALAVWRTPQPQTWIWVLALGLAGTIGHLALTRAFHQADASALMPLDFVRLPAAAVLAYWIFGEVAGMWTWLGAAVIFGSTIYIVRREARMHRRQAVQAESSARGTVQPPDQP